MNVVKFNSQKYFYCLVNDKGDLILFNKQLPIYWNKNLANFYADKWKCNVKKIITTDLERVLN